MVLQQPELSCVMPLKNKYNRTEEEVMATAEAINVELGGLIPSGGT